MISLSFGCTGYGICRPGIQMFDPSWRAPRARGPEDTGTLDAGGDPIGVIDRYTFPQSVGQPESSN